MREPTDFEFLLMDIKDHGASAFHNGTPHTENPHGEPKSYRDEQSRKAHAWFDGWSDEQMLAEDSAQCP